MGFADTVIAKFGADITVKSNQAPAGRIGRGLISPIDLAACEKLRRTEKPGYAGRAKYLLIAGRNVLAEGETNVRVTCGSMEYELMRLEAVAVGRAFSHWEGILRLKGRVSEDA